ncbi:UDP-N-acetylglucosamine 1-carboxyvinyltransferase [Rheinheimera sp.]|uniref:UDP-N-acetylglucosamine 1-carboxyvinyltransferase n=1 Tax=Rheinheimera sp. TaxID=1869214 RepID=UPI00307DEE84
MDDLSKFPNALIIQGGQVLNGRVRVSGAKNSATRLLAASMLTNETVTLRNFPTKLVDAQHKIKFMRNLGVSIDIQHEQQQLIIKPESITTAVLNDYNVPIRTTYLLTAGQIVRNGIARIPYPGGCKIGSRGYDLHIKVWEELGCKVEEKPDFIEIVGNFKGNIIDFPISTVGGTENALICTAVADGYSEIKNAYITPEVDDLIEMLRRMGASIEVFGNSLIRVQGRGGLLKGTPMDVMPDRIEALTWITLALLTKGTLVIDDVPFKHLEIPLIHIEKAGVDLYKNSTSVFISPDCVKAGYLQPFEVACGTHPGVISDMQPFYVLLGLLAGGTSQIYDYRYPKRIGYVEELNKLTNNAMIAKEGQITTQGIAKFIGAEVESTDLRGSMAVIMAGIAASGTTRVNGVSMALRGYNDLVGKLSQVGIEVQEIYE